MSNGFTSGVVSFEPRSEQETEVILKIRSIFDSSNLLRRVEEYLGNFKRLVETSGAEHEKGSDSGRAGSKLLEKIGALCRNTECQKKPRTVAASPAKLRKVAASDSRARSCVNPTATKGRNICMRTLKK
jgi:hypothetical protein